MFGKVEIAVRLETAQFINVLGPGMRPKAGLAAAFFQARASRRSGPAATSAALPSVLA